MRSSVAASVRLSKDRFLKTIPRPALHGTVRGIPMMVRGNNLVVGASGGVAGLGILSNIYGEMDEIDAEMKRFQDEFQAQVPKDSFSIVNNSIIIKPEYLNNDKVRFFALIWTPFILQWKSYRNSQQSYLKSIANILSIWITTGVWDELQEYRGKLAAMVEKAKESDITTIGPDPTPPKENMIEKAGGALAEPAKEVWKVIKIILYAGLVIIGIIVLKGFWIGKSAAGGPMGLVG